MLCSERRKRPSEPKSTLSVGKLFHNLAKWQAKHWYDSDLHTIYKDNHIYYYLLFIYLLTKRYIHIAMYKESRTTSTDNRH